MGDENRGRERIIEDNLFALGLNFNSIDPSTRTAYTTFSPPSRESERQHFDEYGTQ